ncbi:MAG: M20/M25/M40 family metallo-hydrolase [Acidimicrobiales bacterium]
MTLPLDPHTDAEALVESIAALVDINSGSANTEGIQLVRATSGLLAPIGDATVGDPPTIDSLGSDGEQSTATCGPMLELAIRPESERRLLIVGHADTVFGPTSHFQRAERIGDRLHGPGAADMKGGLVVAFEALRQLEAAAAIDNLGIDILVAGDEETALASAPRLPNSPEGRRPDLPSSHQWPTGRSPALAPAAPTSRLLSQAEAPMRAERLATASNAVLAAARQARCVGTRCQCGLDSWRRRLQRRTRFLRDAYQHNGVVSRLKSTPSSMVSAKPPTH